MKMLKTKVIKEIKKDYFYFEVVNGKAKLIPQPEIGKKYVELPKIGGG